VRPNPRPHGASQPSRSDAAVPCRVDGADVSTQQLSDALRQLVSQHVPSMDHAALLVILRDQSEQAHDVAELASSVRLDRSVVEQVLRDLVSSRLIRREGDAVRYDPPPAVSAPLEELVEMYHTKPVTLVRAIYDRPARAAQSFADAFRIRNSEG
jgi:hypothetical protein